MRIWLQISAGYGPSECAWVVPRLGDHPLRAMLAALGDPRTWPAASWPDPQPIPEGLAPVAPFDAALLPDRQH